MTRGSKATSPRQKKRPKASSPDALRRMQRAKRRDTGCELAIRSAVHRMGLLFRVDWKLPDIRRRADLAFVSAKVAVFVDGCFWHVCPIHATWPRANAHWWKQKLEGNRVRDRDTDSCLKAQGWMVLRFWEHEESSKAATKIARVVLRRKQSTKPVSRPIAHRQAPKA